MNNSSPPCRWRSVNWLLLLLQWALGAHFLWMGISKTLDPVTFLKLLRQYELTHNYILLNGIAATLPWLEALCGLLLLTGIALRGTALVCLAMLIPFTLVVVAHARGLSTQLHIPFCAVRFNCGCGAGEVWICRKILENSVQMILTGIIIWRPGGRRAVPPATEISGPVQNPKPDSLKDG